MLTVLRSVLGPTQAKTRCARCHLYEEDGYDEAVFYLEEWDSEDEFVAHVQSDLYSRVLAAAELSRTPPEFTFYYVRETKGMELIEAVRNKPFEKPNS